MRLGVVVTTMLAGSAAAAPARDAQQLYSSGSTAYQAGDYDRAIVLFEEAYALSRAPAILFNIAQAYRLKGLAFCEPALLHYRRSLAEEPAAANRVEIEERIREMERCLVASPDIERDAASRTPPLPIAVTIAGATALVGGGALYWRARDKYQEVERTCPCAPGSFDGWERATAASYLLVAAGAITLGAGLWLWSRSQPPAHGMHLVPVQGGAGVAWTGRF